MTGHVENSADAKQGIEQLKDMGIKYKEFNGLDAFLAGLLNNIKDQRTELKDDASAKAAEEAAKEVNDAKNAK